jgi:membrane dipeptidase
MTDPSTRIFDGHNDTLIDLHIPERGEGRSFFERSETSHIDLPRAREGDFGGGFFAIFVPNEEYEYERTETEEGYEMDLPPAISHERAKQFTYDVLARLYRIEAESGVESDTESSVESDSDSSGDSDTESEGGVRVVGEYEELEACLKDDGTDEDTPIAAIPHLEGAEAVAPDLSNLDFLYAVGVRSIGPVWSRPNEFGHGVRFEYPGTPDTDPGLTDAGRDLVRACNGKGILVDLAHITTAGFRDVAELSTDPLVVSHAAVHDICPVSRNLTDDQIDAVADSDGLVGITFAESFLREDPDAEVSISTLVDHVEYVADRAGVEHVALGSDFDGADVPDAVGDVTGLPDVIAEIRNRGFGEDDVQKIARDNWLRVIRQTWE